MKTFKEFQQIILEKSPGDFVGGRQYSPSSWQGNFLSKGKPTSVAKPNTLRMLTTNPGLNSFLQSRARAALTPRMPNNAAVTIGLGLGQV